MKEGNDGRIGTGDDPVQISRRKILEAVGITCAVLIGAAISLPPLVFSLGPAFRKQKRVWQKIGRQDEFPVGKTVAVTFLNAGDRKWAGATAQRTAWVRHEADETFIAFAVNCTHLGCPVSWEPEANMFLCPCHGGVYYSNGEVAGGPPPRPLEHYAVRVRKGLVEIHTGPSLLS